MGRLARIDGFSSPDRSDDHCKAYLPRLFVRSGLKPTNKSPRRSDEYVIVADFFFLMSILFFLLLLLVRVWEGRRL